MGGLLLDEIEYKDQLVAEQKVPKMEIPHSEAKCEKEQI